MPAAIDQMHIYVEAEDGNLRVSVHYLAGNTSTDAYTGSMQDDGSQATIVFDLPAGATEITPGHSSMRVDVQSSPIRVYETRAIPPGSATLEGRFSYRLPFGTVELTPGIPVHSSVVLIAGDTYQLEGSMLLPYGSMEISGQVARAYTLDPLNAGDTIRFEVTQATAPVEQETAQTPSSSGRDLTIGLSVAVVSAVLAFLIWRPRSARATPDGVQQDVAAIVDLDKRYERGELAGDDYQAQREALKAHIRAKYGQNWQP